MEIADLRNKLVAVLGYGLEGRATAQYLIRHGIQPVLFDHKPWDQWPEPARDEIRQLGLNVVFGPDCLKELAGFDVAFRSPGVKLLDPQLQSLIGNGLAVTSQAKWFFAHSPARIVGVTGTKGKGTTATLISEILKLQCQITESQYQIYLTGNIGKVQPFDFIDNAKKDDIIVYEMSSFQLQDLDRSPHVAVVLMVTQEHLDYHQDVAEYVQAKSNITRHQDEQGIAVINRDFERSMEIGMLGKGRRKLFSRKIQEGADCFVREDTVWLKGENGSESAVAAKRELQLRGDHNLENICAATLAARSLGVEVPVIRQAILGFAGLEHRLEFVAEKQGVKFYNDSFSTTPETAIAAVEAFAEPEIVILGGSSKNSDFSELGRVLVSRPNVKAVVLIGQEAERIKAAMQAAGDFGGQVLEGAAAMQDILAQARSVAEAGDVVILSPACASFGMFDNYKDRGQQFKQGVAAIA